MVRRAVFLRGLGVLALVAVVAACGSSKHVTVPTTTTPTTAAASPASSATTAAPANGLPIKVGVMCSCTGPFGADLLDGSDVYKAWVDSVNASGGINGHQIQLISEDDAATPGTALSDVAQLVSDHVVAIMDNSLVDEAWASAVKAANIPVVGADFTELTFDDNSDFYAAGQTNNSIEFADGATAKASGATNMADMYCAEAPSCSEGVPLLRQIGVSVHIPLIYTAEVAATAPNYTAQCVAAQQAHVSAVFIGDGTVVIDRIGSDCAKQGYEPIYLTEGEGFAPALLTAPGISKNLWSEYGNIPLWDTSAPEVQVMDAAIDKYYPGLRNNAQVWSQEAMQSWPSGLLLSDALKAGGLTPSSTPTNTMVVTGLTSLKGDTLNGMSPPLTFVAGQTHSINCFYIAHISNGVPSLVSNNLTCENGSSSSSS